MVPWVVVLMVAGLSAQQTAGAQQASPSIEEMTRVRSELGPVSLPDLTSLDETVAEQLRKARAEMEAAIAEPDANAQRLAAAYGTLGQLYHAYELYDQAAEAYANASVLEPDEFSWHHLLGRVYHSQDRYEEAVAEYEAAWSLEPNDFAALVYLGEVYLGLNREDDAEVVYGRALALSPGSPSAMAGLGNLALRRRDYEKAVVYFTSALASVPAANRLHYSLAMAYRGLGRLEDAKYHLGRRGTVGLTPRDPLLEELEVLREGERVHLVRGRLAFASERYEEARQSFQRAVDAAPESVRSIINLGTALARTGDTEGAMEQYEKAIELDPTNLTAPFNLASLLTSQEAWAAAKPHLMNVVDGAPEDGEAQLLLAKTLVALGEDEAALEPFEKAAVIDPASFEAVVGGAAALVRLGQHARAKNVLEAGLERMPTNGPITFALARVLSAAPDPDVRDGERALALALKVYEAQSTPRHAQVVAQALGELGRCEEAAEWQQILVEGARRDGAEEAAEVLARDLEMYRAGPPCRPPVR
jgi:tetratricopeptide (TPR) repeat protein